ncbi:Mediator of RNA polymerase II transcription subunit 4 [Camellia lanceoleosa]|uniref:Mediator of RNA polymerase II transcription subunit 4 n=1 Tax=Camellia lanceoleosa TaxID=1840588 RepID=A0ACC0GEB7_9ERIC|nr:Mediator of RNA polymerase II transcription subunit 4 [Camellia lanceoleosa]
MKMTMKMKMKVKVEVKVQVKFRVKLELKMSAEMKMEYQLCNSTIMSTCHVNNYCRWDNSEMRLQHLCGKHTIIGNYKWVTAMQWSGQKNYTNAPIAFFLVDCVQEGVMQSYGPLTFLKICSTESRFIFLQIYQGFSEREWKFKMLQNVPHQIVQSPARLGLPNPNSPSLQNPTPPKSSSQVPQSQLPNQQSNLSKATTTSSTLLPLLPPLSRAPVSSPSNGFLCISAPLVQPDFSPSTTKEVHSLFTTLQTQLFEAVAELQEILDLQDAKQKVAREIRISYTTFAPPEFGVGQATWPESKEKTIEPFIEACPAQQPDSNPLANLTGIQGLIPPNFVIPSGWKPEMPVELPSDLPMMPPLGWKPGDPVPLPLLDTLPVAGRIEEQPPRPIPAQGIPKVPEPIHVRHVELDIDDDSSDMGSSDDED